jgi:histidinol-phosphate aminotransferase
MSADRPLRDLAVPAVQKIAPYVPGKPIEELEREYGVANIVKLASNENPLGPGPLAVEAIENAAREIGLYPDGNGFELKQALARRHGCDLTCITLGNGSNDVLALLAQAYLTADTEAVYSEYSFAVYPIVVQATGAVSRVAPALSDTAKMPLGHDLDAMRQLVGAKTRLVFVANPNNPTGTWVDTQPLRDFIASIPQTSLVILDEAYIEYATDALFPDSSKWLREFPNLVVTRTFSKAFGLAGARVGFALSNPDVADMLNRVRQPFNVSSLALSAACAALRDTQHLEKSVAMNRQGLDQLAHGFDAMGIRRYPSAGNFVLIDCAQPAAPLYEALLRAGIIVRPVANYGLPNHLRITIGTREQNERLLAALAGHYSSAAKSGP